MKEKGEEDVVVNKVEQMKGEVKRSERKQKRGSSEFFLTIKINSFCLTHHSISI